MDKRALRNLPDQERLISRALWQAENAVDRALDRVFAPLGLTTTLQGTLRFIADEPGQSAADLARRAGVRPQSVAYAVAKLEGLGLIVREPHPVHGRVMQTYPTDAGHRALAEASELLDAAERELTRDFTNSESSRLFDQLQALRFRAEQLYSSRK